MEKKAKTQTLPRDVIALFGAYNLDDQYEDGRILLSPENIKVHGDWNPSLPSNDADIAILTFTKRAIHFSVYVQPICLWNGDTPPSVTEGFVAGWGKNRKSGNKYEVIPTKLKIPIHTNEDCWIAQPKLTAVSSPRTLCAGSADGTGLCNGDSGGGLSIKVGSTFYFRGIVSASLLDGVKRCDVKSFAVFTDVLKFKHEIDQVLSEQGEILLLQVVRSYLKCTNKEQIWRFEAQGCGCFPETNFRKILTCNINNQKVDSEGFFIAGDPNQSVEAFIIQHNIEVKFLPENIAKSFPELLIYKVHECSIRTVKGIHFKGLHKLEILNLDRNYIKSIEGDPFKDLKKLNILSLNFNRIETIDPNFFQSLDNLWTFGITLNQIEFLDEKLLNNLKSLRDIRLAGNQLTTISANLFKNNFELVQIILQDNKIQAISSTTFEGLIKLRFLLLSQNEIESIDGDPFGDLIKLEVLDLSFNRIKTIEPNSFKSFESLRLLFLAHNQIQLLDEKIFDNLKNMTFLALDNNKLSTVPANLLKNNLKLGQIGLHQNIIQTISSTMFDHLYNLTYINLVQNVCVNDLFRPDRSIEMKNYLRMNCRSSD